MSTLTSSHRGETQWIGIVKFDKIVRKILELFDLATKVNLVSLEYHWATF